MHGRHKQAAQLLLIIFSNVVGLLLGDHARASATPSKWPTETALAVAVGHHNGITHVSTF